MSNFDSDDLIHTRLRVMTWNLWWQLGPWEERYSPILETLRAVDADIIALQEVWDDETNNQAAKLAEELGFHYTYAHGVKLGDVTMGNAILSRWPITKTEILSLYCVPEDDEKRIALYGEIDGPRGIIPFTCTHTNWQQHHSHIRQKQLVETANFIASQKNHNFPPILCGDFNADPDSDEIRVLTGKTSTANRKTVFHDAWAFMHPDKAGATWDNSNPYTASSFEPNRRLDYIFAGWARSRGAGHIVDCRLAGNAPTDGVWPSDHFAIVAELRY